MKKLQHVIWRWNFAFMLLMTTIVISIVAITGYKMILTDYSQSKSDLLARLAEQSEVISKSASLLAQDIYTDQAYYLLTKYEDTESLSEAIAKTTAEANRYFQSIGVELSVTIIMESGFQYATKHQSEDEFNEIKGTYWYIDNFSNDKNQIWTMRLSEDGKHKSAILSYGKIVRNGAGEYAGIILVNASERAYYGLYRDVVDDYNKAYILDENGRVISHSQTSLIGMNLVYMPYFIEQYRGESYGISRKGGRNVLTTVLHDDLTKWTFVLESDLSYIYQGYIPSLLSVGIIMICIIIVWAIGFYILAQKVSMPLKFFSDSLNRAANENFQPVQLGTEYKEVYDVGVIYNKMVCKIENLIHHIKSEEQEKRKSELAFLQMQINPHFMHNTLFSIKCLIDLGKTEEAAKMTELFMKMLTAPIHAQNEFITLKSEAQGIETYVELMSYRYGSKVRLEVYIDESADDFMVPRLIFQPIVENSIFYGFNNMDENCVIDLFAYITDDCLYVEIRDNGCGISREEIENIYTRRKNEKLAFNNVGLTNIKERIRILYGPKSFLSVSSIEGEGTSTVMCLQRVEEKE